jgi:hypothetical protein
MTERVKQVAKNASYRQAMDHTITHMTRDLPRRKNLSRGTMGVVVDLPMLFRKAGQAMCTLCRPKLTAVIRSIKTTPTADTIGKMRRHAN